MLHKYGRGACFSQMDRNLVEALGIGAVSVAVLSPTCPCGQEDQTTEHVLQRCPFTKLPVSTPLTTKLYGCKQELEKTTPFISREALVV